MFARFIMNFVRSPSLDHDTRDLPAALLDYWTFIYMRLFHLYFFLLPFNIFFMILCSPLLIAFVFFMCLFDYILYFVFYETFRACFEALYDFRRGLFSF